MNDERVMILLQQLGNIVHNCSKYTDTVNYTDDMLDSLCEIIRIHNKYGGPEIKVKDFRKNRNPEIKVKDFRKNRNPVKVISAKDARERSNKIYNDELNFEFDLIMETISNSKAYSITVRGKIYNENRERLIQLGYNLKRVGSVNNDADEIITTIQW
jgi:hypothetical protein